MNNEWMIEILNDMRHLAFQNAMTGLAEHLDDAIIVAAIELQEASRAAGTTEGHDSKNRAVAGPLEDGGHASRSPETG